MAKPKQGFERDFKEAEKLRIILVAKMSAAAKVVYPAITVATHRREGAPQSSRERYVEMAHSIRLGKDRRMFARACCYLHSAFLLSRKFGNPFLADKENGPRAQTEKILAADCVTDMPLYINPRNRFLDPTEPWATRYENLLDACETGGFAKMEGGSPAFRSNDTLITAMPDDVHTYVGIQGVQIPMHAVMTLTTSKVFTDWVSQVKDSLVTQDAADGKIPEVRRLTRGLVEQFRQVDPIEAGGEILQSYETRRADTPGRNEEINWTIDFPLNNPQGVDVPRRSSPSPRRDHRENKSKGEDSRDRAHHSSESSHRTRERGDNGRSGHKGQREKGVRSRSPHKDADNYRPPFKGETQHPEKRKGISERLGPTIHAESNQQSSGRKVIVSTTVEAEKSDRKVDKQSRPHVTKEIAHAYMESMLNQTGQMVLKPTLPPKEADGIIDPLIYFTVLAGNREKVIMDSHEKEKDEILAKCDRRVAKMQRELLIHKRIRIRHDTLSLVSLLQDLGLEFNSCSRCLQQLKRCKHVRPIQMDGRIPASEDEDDDEDVLQIHPDADEKFELEEAEDDSVLFRALDTVRKRVVARRAFSANEEDEVSQRQELEVKKTVRKKEDGEDQSTKDNEGSRGDPPSPTGRPARNSGAYPSETMEPREHGNKTPRGDGEVEVPQEVRVLQEESRKRAGEIYELKQTTETRATAQLVFAEAAAQATNDVVYGGQPPLAIYYTDQQGEVQAELVPNLDSNGQNYYTGGDEVHPPEGQVPEF